MLIEKFFNEFAVTRRDLLAELVVESIEQRHAVGRRAGETGDSDRVQIQRGGSRSRDRRRGKQRSIRTPAPETGLPQC